MIKFTLRLAIVILAACLAFYFWGRSLWHPIWVKIEGGRTVTEVVESLRNERGFQFDAQQWERLVILGIKDEQILEVWAVNAARQPTKLKEFPFTGFSGKPGPKLREGDRQIPEGVYRIEYLNPNSSFHLSMKLDYPNAFDRQKGAIDGRTRLGYDIFIHGRSSTVGCIPIGDEGIEELFYMVAEIGAEKVDVILAPYDMRKTTRTVDIPEIDWESELYAQIRTAITATFGTESIATDVRADTGSN